MMVRRRLNGLGPALLFAGICLILAGCGSSQGQAAAGSSLTKFKLSYSSVSYSQNGILVAKDGGLFEKNGVDAELVLTPNGIKSQLAGELQGSVTSTEEVIQAVAGGADIEIVATFLPYLQQDFLVRPEIKTMADLKGKPVGVTRRGTITETVSRMAAEQGGLNPDRDLQLIELDTAGQMITALTAGSIYGGAYSSPNSDVAISQGAHVLYPFSTQNIPYPAANLIVTRAWAQKNEATLLAVLKSLAQATQVFKTQPDFVASVYAKYAQTGVEAGKKAAENAKAGIPAKMLPTAEGIKVVQDTVARQNPAVTKIDVSKFFDDSYIKKLDAQGFYAQLGK